MIESLAPVAMLNCSPETAKVAILRFEGEAVARLSGGAYSRM